MIGIFSGCFLISPEAFLAFRPQIPGGVQEAVDLVAVPADKQAALFFSGGAADRTIFFGSIGA